MIGEITDNIIAGLINKGLSGKDDIQDTREIIIAELGKYDISRKETSLVIYDKTDTEIVARFFLAKATAGLSDKSLKYYRHVLEGALPKLGKRLNDVKADDIRAYLTMRRIQAGTAARSATTSQGRPITSDGRSRSPSPRTRTGTSFP